MNGATLSIASSFLGLQSYEWWVIAIGALVCISSGILGCFLILRKMALMGDAISHSVLPGIAVAAWLTGSLSSFPAILGATVVGLLTPMLIDVLRSTGRIHEDASLGLVFTILFSAGVVMIANMGNIHLDLDCVLFGEIATTPFDRWIVSGVDLGPRAFWSLGAVLLLDIGFVVLFYKELKVSTFDPILAASMGLRPRVLHYMLLGMVALTTIAAFESVGAILVVAMLIAPGAAAYLLTDRLAIMLLLSALIGVLCAGLGYGMALAMGGKVSVAGTMSTTAGLLFAGAFLFSPRYGLVSQAWKRVQLSRRLRREHILSTLYRWEEDGGEWMEQSKMCELLQLSLRALRRSGQTLMQKGWLLWEDGRMHLTKTGRKRGQELVRAHRLWEAYLEDKLNYPPDHVHRDADEMEHFLSPELQRQLELSLDSPATDPHGKPIPGGVKGTR
ncbi:MAG: iron ABC transporter [Deltaproteobacteria bacterium]|nr:MAG: iron ABC transporter [Deltaproteobacteria bacterium]